MPVVPYTRIRRAEREMLEQHPDASRVRGLWTPASRCEIHVEVWRGDHADVLGWEPSR